MPLKVYFQKGRSNLIIRQNIIFSLLFAFSITATIYLFVPSAVFFANANELKYNYIDLIRAILPSFSFYLLIITTVLMMLITLCDKVKNIIFALLLATCIAFWIESTFLSSGYGFLDGATKIDLTSKIPLLSSAIWLCIYLLSIVFYKRLSKFKVHILLVLVIAQFGAILPKILQTTNKYEEHFGIIRDQDMFSFNKDKNVIMIILDSLGQEFFENAINDDNISKAFKDFTYFSDYLSLHGRTIVSGAAQMNGEPYFNQEPLEQFKVRLLSDNESLPVYLKNLGFKLKYLGFDYGINVYNINNVIYDNYKLKKDINYYDIINTSYFNVFPPVIKGYFAKKVFAKNWDFEFLQDMRTKSFDNREKSPVFFLTHLVGAHAPWIVDSNMQKVSISTIQEQAIGSLKLVIEFIENLKKAGVYDNSLIVITADHAAGPPKTYDAWTMLLIKPIGQTNKEVVNNKIPLSQRYLHRIIKKYLIENPFQLDNLSVIDDKRYTYSFNHHVQGRAGYLSKFTKYMVTGHAGNPLSYVNIDTQKEFNVGDKLVFPADYEKVTSTFPSNVLITDSGLLVNPSDIFLYPAKNKEKMRIKLIVSKPSDYEGEYYYSDGSVKTLIEKDTTLVIEPTGHKEMLLKFTQPIIITSIEFLEPPTVSMNKDISYNSGCFSYGEGFYNPEAGGIWATINAFDDNKSSKKNKHLTSDIYFKIDNISDFKSNSLEFKYSTYKDVAVTFYLNGVKVYQSSKSTFSGVINIPIKPDLLKEGDNILGLEFSDARRPDNGDVRYLSAIFKSLNFKYIQPVKPNEVYKHSSSSLSFGAGFYNPEAGGIWATINTSDNKTSLTESRPVTSNIYFKVDNISDFNDTALEFSCSTYKHVAITFYLNGFNVYQTPKSEFSGIVNIPINAELLKEGDNVLGLEFSDARRPDNGDVRYLSAIFRSLIFRNLQEASDGGSKK